MPTNLAPYNYHRQVSLKVCVFQLVQETVFLTERKEERRGEERRREERRREGKRKEEKRREEKSSKKFFKYAFIK